MTAAVVVALLAALLVVSPQATADSGGAVPNTLAKAAAKRLDAGGDSTCAIGDDDVLRCWGSNEFGQLGDGTTIDRGAPTVVALAGTPVAVSVGARNACALLADGTAQCWGQNHAGQVGDGTMSESHTTAPATVQGLPGAVKQIDVGLYFACALLVDTTVYCWGDSNSYRLGQDIGGENGLPQPAPVQVPDLVGVTTISLSLNGACALREAATVTCWGVEPRNDRGSLPAEVPALTGSAAISLSIDDRCGILQSGSTTCFSGRLPTISAISVSAGPYFVCAVVSAGTVHCEGRNREGGLGVGTTTETTNTPVVGITNALSVTVGTYHACAALADGNVVCWGQNANGQVGDPAQGGDSLSPVRLRLPQLFLAVGAPRLVAAGRDHTCVTRDESSPIECVGANDQAQLTEQRPAIRPPSPFERTLKRATNGFFAYYSVWESIDARENQTCALSDDGKQYCWGDGPVGDFEFTTNNYTRASTVEVSLGGQHQCLRRTAYVPVPPPSESAAFGYLRCWGNNSAGQIGVPGTGPFATSQRILLPDVTRVGRIDAGAVHSCALGTVGDDPEQWVYCWGDASNSATGPRGGSLDHEPVQVHLGPTGAGNAQDVAVGSSHSCAVSALGGVYCWGSNSWGELGRSTNETAQSVSPLLVPDLSFIEKVFAGYQHNCAIDADGTAWCWGLNDDGQLGNGTTGSTHVPTAVTLPGGAAVRTMSLGPEHSCAITVEDQLFCWGDGDNGELGTLAESLVPRTVPGISVTAQLPEPEMCNGLLVTIDMNTNGGSGVGTNGDDVILGTPANDSIDGGDGNDTICGLGGDDVLIGGDGDDNIFGQEGDDIARGNPGADLIDGGPGNDRLLGGIGDDELIGRDGNDYLGGFGGDDRISGGTGNDVIFGGFGADRIAGDEGNDTIRGLIGDDSIGGGPGNDVLDGDRGNDSITGGPGDDVIRGGNARDVLNGDEGDDSVSGGRADDDLYGGPGIDVCVGNNHLITDVADSSCETIFGVP